MTSKLTRDIIQSEIADFFAGVVEIHTELGGPNSVEEAQNQLTERVLACMPAMDSKPVFFIEVEGDDWINAGRIEGKNRQDLGLLPDGINYLYAAPQPAPVVPPMQHWEELCRQYPDMSIRDAIIRAAWWNHCRAAMLQAGNSPVIPDGFIPAAQKLLERYLANPGTHSEFIACWTPSKSSIGTGGVWDEWKALEFALAAVPKDEAKKDKPHNNFGTGARLTNHRFKV
ncbi:TPA: hypothetical protein I8167_005111 [Raoultella ornithinolytica]|nr:hypothetical protein [Raoultella ornithinolytica]HAT2559234.1 hypothetical protein [Raoultella ornithinolytica]